MGEKILPPEGVVQRWHYCIAHTLYINPDHRHNNSNARELKKLMGYDKKKQLQETKKSKSGTAVNKAVVRLTNVNKE